MRRVFPLLLALSLVAGCATAPLAPAEAARLAALLPADALLLGEQHDAPEHQQLQRRTLQWLAARDELAALAIEMAEQGRGTAGLPRGASEAEVRAALAWPEQGWPWERYGPTVMAAVRAGVPVLGADLPRARLREAMADATLDARLPPAALQAQAERIREGHCNALPEAQIAPMTRVQIARDRAMADTVAGARQRGRTVLLVAGNGHVHRTLGVPAHLPADLQSKVVVARSRQAPEATDSGAKTSQADAGADLLWPTPPRDYCAAFRRPQ
ncbi:MAG: ChaN family lipoprotein [Ottowia sp.]|uniref:ChaN family lipoprotein n=1 Tax=Ottowia sp. TaxID=1898956 RepID=UPI0039E2C8DD